MKFCTEWYENGGSIWKVKQVNGSNKHPVKYLCLDYIKLYQ